MGGSRLGTLSCPIDLKFLPVITINLRNSDTEWADLNSQSAFLQTGLNSVEYRLHQDMVLVTLQYRLGPLGFLTTEDSTAPGNMGLHDQIAGEGYLCVVFYYTINCIFSSSSVGAETYRAVRWGPRAGDGSRDVMT